MLHLAHHLKDLDFSALMAVYEEGNRENGEDLWPDLPQGLRLLRAEQEFYTYLQDVFFAAEDALYCIWRENGIYISALRLERYKDGWLLEALETAPEHRRMGMAAALIRAVQALGRFDKIYSHVGKKNEASLGVHEKCGFRRIAECAYYIDGSVNSRACTMVWERTPG